MHTHDVLPRMLPSQQNMGEYTPTMYSHGCCLHNRVQVNVHPQRTATDVAFTAAYGWMRTHSIRPRMLPSLKVRVPAHPQHTPCEFLGDVQGRLKGHNLYVGLFPLVCLLCHEWTWRINCILIVFFFIFISLLLPLSLFHSTSVKKSTQSLHHWSVRTLILLFLSTSGRQIVSFVKHGAYHGRRQSLHNYATHNNILV